MYICANRKLVFYVVMGYWHIVTVVFECLTFKQKINKWINKSNDSPTTKKNILKSFLK